MSDPFPAWCGAYVVDRQSGSVLASNFHDNLTHSTVTVAPTWSVRGLTSKDVGAFGLLSAGHGVVPFTVANSASNPVDFETSGVLRYIISSEVATRLVHDENGVPSPHISIDEPLDPQKHNWTTYTLGVATIEIIVVLEDSPDVPVIVRTADVWSDKAVFNAYATESITSMDQLLSLDPLSDATISRLGTLSGMTNPAPTSLVAASGNGITNHDIKLLQTFESARSQAVGLPIKVFDDDSHPSRAVAELDLVWALRPLTTEDAKTFATALVGKGIAQSCGRSEELPYPFNMSVHHNFGLVPVCDQIEAERDAAVLQRFEVRGTVASRPAKGFAVEATLQIFVSAPEGLTRPQQGFVLAVLAVRDGQAALPRETGPLGAPLMPARDLWLPGRETALLVNISVQELPEGDVVVSPEIVPTSHDLQQLTAASTLNVFARPDVPWSMRAFDGGPIEPALPRWMSITRTCGVGSVTISVLTNATGLANGRPAATFSGRIVPGWFADSACPDPGGSPLPEQRGRPFDVTVNMRAGRLVLGTGAIDVLVRPGERETALTSVLNAGADSLTVTLTASEPWIGLVASSVTQGASGGNASSAALGSTTITLTLAPGQNVPIQVSVAPPVSRPESLVGAIRVTSSDPLSPRSSVGVSVQVAWSTACPTDVSLSASPTTAGAARIDVNNISPFTLSLAIDSTSLVITDAATGQPIQTLADTFVAVGGTLASNREGDAASRPATVRILQDRLAPASRPSAVFLGLNHPRAATDKISGFTEFHLHFDLLSWRRTQQEEDFAAVTALASSRVGSGTVGDGGAAASLMRRAVQSLDRTATASRDSVNAALERAGATLIERRGVTVRYTLLPGPVDAATSTVTALPADRGFYGPGGVGTARVVWMVLARLPMENHVGYNFTFDQQLEEALAAALAAGFASTVPDWTVPSLLTGAEQGRLEDALGTVLLAGLVGAGEPEELAAGSIPGQAEVRAAQLAQHAAQAAGFQEELEALLAGRGLRSGPGGAIGPARALGGSAAGSDRLPRDSSIPGVHRRQLLLCPHKDIRLAPAYTNPLCSMPLPRINGTAFSFDLQLTMNVLSAVARPTEAQVDAAVRTAHLTVKSAAAKLRQTPRIFPETVPGNGLVEGLVITADEFGQLTTAADGIDSAGGLEIAVLTLASHQNSTGVPTGLVGARPDPLLRDVTRVTIKPTETGTLVALVSVSGEQVARSGQVVAVTGASCPPPALVPDASGLHCICGPGFAFDPSVGLGCVLCPEGTEKLSAANLTRCSTCEAGTFSLGGRSRCRACLPGTACSEGRATLLPGTWHEDPRDHLAAINASLDRSGSAGGSDSPEMGGLPTARHLLAPSARHKWWLEVSSLRFHQCPVARACPVNDSLQDSASQACALGHSGPLCAVCQPGFATATGLAGSQCERCWDETSSWLATALAVVGVVALLAIVAAPSKTAIERAGHAGQGDDDGDGAAGRPSGRRGHAGRAGRARGSSSSAEVPSGDGAGRGRRRGMTGVGSVAGVAGVAGAVGGAARGLAGTALPGGPGGRGTSTSGRWWAATATTTTTVMEPASDSSPTTRLTRLIQAQAATGDAVKAAKRAAGGKTPTLMDEVLKANAERLKVKTAAAKERATPVMRSLVNYLQALAVLATLRISGGEGVRTMLALAEVAGGATLSLLPVQCATGMGFLERFAASLALPLVACVAPFAVAVLITALQLLRRAVRPLTDPIGSAAASLLPRGCSADGRDAAPSRSSRMLTESPSMNLEAVVAGGTTGALGGRKPARNAASLSGWPLLRHNLRSASYSVVAILFVIHFGTLRAIFRAFEVYPNRIYGVIFLQADFVTHTESTDYSSVILPLAVLGGVVYGLGIPLLGVLVLVRNSDRLRNPAVLARYGFLYRGLSLTRRGRFLFEGVVLVRKTGLALIAAFGAVDPLGQGYLAALWLLLFLVTHLILKPYTDPVVNGLEAVSLTTLTISQVANMYYAASGLAWLPVLVLLGNGLTVAAFVAVLLALSSTAARYAWLQAVRAARALRDDCLARFCLAPPALQTADDTAAAAAAAAAAETGSERSAAASPGAAPTALLGASVTRSAGTAARPADARRPSMLAFSNPMRGRPAGTMALPGKVQAGPLALPGRAQAERLAGRESVTKHDLRGRFTVRRPEAGALPDVQEGGE